MEWGAATLGFYGLGAVAAAGSIVALHKRIELSRAKHRSLSGHSRLARRLAALMPFYSYDDEGFFCSDGAPAEVVARRRAGFARLSGLYKARFAETIRRTTEASENISDLQFTNAYRIPFQ